MSGRSILGRCLATLAISLLALWLPVRAAKPEWAGNGGIGNASQNNNWTTGFRPGTSDIAKVANGKATVDIDLNFGSLEFTGGIIDGAYSLTLLGSGGSSVWTGGEFTHATVNANGITISIGNAKKVVGGAKLNLAGTTLWTGGTISTGGGASISNQTGATFTTNFDGKMAYDLGGVRPEFRNSGTFSKSAGSTGGVTEIEAVFANTGVVSVASGTLRLSGGGSSSGSVNIGNGAQLELASDYELFANSELKGLGKARFFGGSLKTDGAVEVQTFSFESGVLEGNNTFSGTIDWKGGRWNSSAPGITTVIAAGGVLHLNQTGDHEFNRRSIVNQGMVNWNAGNLRGGQGSVFTNQAVFNDLAGGDKSIAAPGAFGGSFTFLNLGTYLKNGNGTTTVEVGFTNNGGLHILSGTMVFTGPFTGNGQIKVANGAQAKFQAPLVLGPATPLGGSGTLTASRVEAGGPVSPGVSPGTLNITGDLTLLSTSTLLIDIGGPQQGVSYDFLNVGGTAVLAGELRVSFLDGYQWTMPPGSMFTILGAAGGVSGTFANAPTQGFRIFSTDNLTSFQVNYTPSALTLSNFVAVPEPATWVLLTGGLGTLLVRGLRRRR